jgi:hypothetical protein
MPNPAMRHIRGLVGRPVAVVAIGVVEAVFGAKEQGGHHEKPR